MKCKNKNVRNRKSNIILPTRDCEKRSIAINRKMRLRD